LAQRLLIIQRPKAEGNVIRQQPRCIGATQADERVTDVAFSDEAFTVHLRDGRAISVQLAWYPRLLAGSHEQRTNWQICAGGCGIHWPDLDEDLSTEGLLRGAPVPRR